MQQEILKEFVTNLLMDQKWKEFVKSSLMDPKMEQENMKHLW